jgi:methylmalonyl-CoA/ethylmalonyl-CoA epimerase
MRLHHIGYVVADIESAVRGFCHSIGASWEGEIFTDPHQKVRVTFLSTHFMDAQIELVQPAADDSPVSNFLTARGGGLHHTCYEVPNLESELVKMKSRGALIVKRSKPAVAFGGRPIAWILTSEKLLVELLENKKADMHTDTIPR